MTTRKLYAVYAVTALVVSLPFLFLHLNAKPDDAPITPLQHLVAALANYFGPWGVAIVRLVDFPNAGMRSFSWAWSIGLTLVGGSLLVLPMGVRKRAFQFLLMALWGLFSIVWFVVGLGQIADGLL